MIPDVKYGDDGWPVMQWFGESWGAPICQHAPHAETPVGEPCDDGCGEPIRDGDQGYLVPLLREREEPVYLAHHRACWLRSIGLHE